MTVPPPVNTVLLGDCLSHLRTLDSDSVDAVVTDPPYGLGTKEPTGQEIVDYIQGKALDTGGDFMGREWAIPSVETWKEVYRVLKPGAHCLVFAGTRAWDLMALGLRVAGFEFRDTIADLHPALVWLQGSGFPKGLDVGKAINKKKGAERAVVGIDPNHRSVSGVSYQGAYAGGNTGAPVLTAPATPEAKQWDGWNVALKPSWEPILVCRKPLSEKTVAANVLKHGTGAIHINACRVGTAKNVPTSAGRSTHSNAWGGDSLRHETGEEGGHNPNLGRWPPNATFTHSEECQPIGTKRVKLVGATAHRTGQGSGGTFVPQGSPHAGYKDDDGTETVEAWVCTENCPVCLLDAQSEALGIHPAGNTAVSECHHNGSVAFGNIGSIAHNPNTYKDEGGASRFFPQFEPFKYVPKVHTKERTQDGRLTNPHPCLHPDALVLTEDGYRQISAIEVGNRVYAADGRFHLVSHTTRHTYTKEHLYRIHVKGLSDDTLVTNNHPFLVWRPTRQGARVVSGQVAWVRAEDLRVGDYTMTPRLAESVETPIDLPTDPELWFLFGLYLAEGSLDTKGYLVFSLHQKETYFVDKMRQCYGASTVRTYPSKQSLSMNVFVFSKQAGACFKAWGGSGASKKRLAPVIWSLPQPLRRMIFQGWMAGDGGLIRNHWQAKTVSPDLAVHMMLLGESCGYKARVYRSMGTTKGIGTRLFKKTLPVYQLDFSKSDRLAGPVAVRYEDTDYTLRYVDSVGKESYCGEVVNLSVEGSPTFMTAIGMSHNTLKPLALLRWLVTLVTPPNGLVLDPFCGSGTTLQAAIELGFSALGCEKDPEFHKLSQDRLALVLQAQQDKTDARRGLSMLDDME